MPSEYKTAERLSLKAGFVMPTSYLIELPTPIYLGDNCDKRLEYEEKRAQHSAICLSGKSHRLVCFCGATNNKSRTKAVRGKSPLLAESHISNNEHRSPWDNLAIKLLDWLAAHPEFEIPPELSTTLLDKKEEGR